MPLHRKLNPRLLCLCFLIGNTLILAPCGPAMSATTHPSIPPQRTTDLMQPIFWAALITFLIVEGLLLLSVIRFRRRSTRTNTTRLHGNTRVEILWTALPALILLILAILTYLSQTNTPIPPPS